MWGETAKFNGIFSIELLYKIKNLFFDYLNLTKSLKI